MSYKYGTNGNDLNWDAIMELYDYCLDCEELKQELKENILKALDPYFFFNLEEKVDNFIDDLMCEYECSNHTHIYSPVEIDFELLYREGKTIEDITSWYIVHDTNGNFVTLVGDVPDDYLTEEYIRERDEYLKAAIY